MDSFINNPYTNRYQINHIILVNEIFGRKSAPLFTLMWCTTCHMRICFSSFNGFRGSHPSPPMRLTRIRPSGLTGSGSDCQEKKPDSSVRKKSGSEPRKATRIRILLNFDPINSPFTLRIRTDMRRCRHRLTMKMRIRILAMAKEWIRLVWTFFGWYSSKKTGSCDLRNFISLINNIILQFSDPSFAARVRDQLNA